MALIYEESEPFYLYYKHKKNYCTDNFIWCR